MKSVLGLHVESIDVVQKAIPCFGDNGERPPIAFHVGCTVLHFPGDDGIAHNADAMRVGDHDRAIEQAGIFKPRGAGHFSIAVEREPGAKDRVGRGFSAGQNRGDAGANGAFADFEFAVAGNERGVADLDAFDVRNRVIRAGRAVEGNAQIAGAGLGLRTRGSGCEYRKKEDEEKKAEAGDSIHILIAFGKTGTAHAAV